MKFPHSVSSTELLKDFLPKGAPRCSLGGIGSPASFEQDSLVFVSRRALFRDITTQPLLLLVEESLDVGDFPYQFVRVPNLNLVMIKVLSCVQELFFQDHEKPCIHPSACIDPSVVIGEGVHVGPNVTIEKGCTLQDNVVVGAGTTIHRDCSIGPGVRIDAQCVLYPRVSIGLGTRVSSLTVIGVPGFGFEMEQGTWTHMPHLGGVSIGRNCFIGSHVSIVSGVLHPTKISDNVIIDNHVQIAHNVSIGKGTAIAGCVGIAGSVSIGSYCLIGGGAGISGHLSITDKVTITAMTMVIKSITQAGVYSSGMNSEDNKSWLKKLAYLSRLPKLFKDFYEFKKKVGIKEEMKNSE